VVQHCYAALLGNLGRTDDAIRAWERAIELDPNNAGARAGLGIARIFKRRADRSLELIDGALRRSPADPLCYHWLANRALALMLTRRVDEAIETAQKSIQRRPSRISYAVLAATLAHVGRDDESGAAWRELAKWFPRLNSDDFARLAGAMAPDEEWGEEITRALRRAAEMGGSG